MFAVGETPAQLQHLEEASGGLARCVGRTINTNITVEHQLLIMMNNCSRQVIVLPHAIFSIFFFSGTFIVASFPGLPHFLFSRLHSVILCIILNANRRTKNGRGLRMRLHQLKNICWVAQFSPWQQEVARTHSSYVMV